MYLLLVFSCFIVFGLFKRYVWSVRLLSLVIQLSFPLHAVANEVSLKPYNAGDYDLAFNALLADGDLNNAWLLANHAVKQAPSNRLWHQRLAQLSEWTQHREEAFKQWRYLFDQTPSDPLVLEAMMRLAPVMGDSAIMLTIWLKQHALDQLTPTLLIELSDLFEANSQPREGAELLDKLYRYNKQPTYLAASARLYERMGREGDAIARYEQLLTLPSIEPEWAMSAAMLYLNRRDIATAQQIMQANSIKLSSTSHVAFWQLLGQLSWQMQKDSAILHAYKALAKVQPLSAVEQERLFLVISGIYPEQAAQLSYSFYEQYRDVQYLFRTLAISSQHQDWQGFARYMATSSTQDLQQLSHRADFLVMRGQYYARMHQLRLADQDIRTAYQLSRHDADILSQILFYYLDQDQIDNVRMLLTQYRSWAINNSVLWPAFAAGYHRLDRVAEAIIFYQKQLEIDRHNPLLMLNYAEALSRSGQQGRAQQLRAIAWKRLRDARPIADVHLPLSRAPELIAYDNLRLLNEKGDQADQAMQRLIQRMKAASDTEKVDQDANDLVLSWAINNNAITAAKLWLRQQYKTSSMSQAPLWGQAAVALQTNDRLMLSKLNQHANALSPNDRHDVAQTLGFSGIAADVAFNNLRVNPHDSEMHQRYVDSYLKQTSLMGVQTGITQGDGLVSTSAVLFTNLVINPQWHIGFEVNHAALSQNADSAYSDAVTRNQLLGVNVSHLRERSQFLMAMRQHDGLATWQSTELVGNYVFSHRLSVSSDLRYNMPSRDSTIMSLVGRESVLQASLSYGISSRDALRLSTQWASYETQIGEKLGDGRHIDWELSHRLYRDYPDWGLRILGAHRRYEANAQTVVSSEVMSIFANASLFVPTAQTLLPRNTDYYGLCAGMGQAVAQLRQLDGSRSVLDVVYSKSWRPIIDVCATYNSASSTTGYSGLAGIRGSLDGEDQLLLLYQESNGGLQLPNQTLRAINATYERLF